MNLCHNVLLQLTSDRLDTEQYVESLECLLWTKDWTHAPCIKKVES